MTARPRVLCVDDEPLVLEGLQLTLRRHYEVHVAVGGLAGIITLQTRGPFQVVLSDMRMPAMDGATFLGRARTLAPDAVRMLLTGHTDLDAAIAAVNKGQIFRFLTKPCPPEDLLAAMAAAVKQHELLTAERVLLEQTLHGSIKMLCDLLSLANPLAYGRGTRLQHLVRDLAFERGVPHAWHVEIAAMLSQVSHVVLPTRTIEKLDRGQPLTADEQYMVDRLPTISEQLIASIPRLEEVREILQFYPRRFDGASSSDGVAGEQLPWGARALALALAYDRLEHAGIRTDLALLDLRRRKGAFDPELLQALEAVLEHPPGDQEVEPLMLYQLREGMIFADEIKSKTGVLLVARGHEATLGLIERLKNNASDFGIAEPLQMIVGRAEPSDPPATA